MEMRSLYNVSLPTERDDNDDRKTHDDWVKKNESCLNMNFGLISDKLYELELRMAVLEAAVENIGSSGSS
ncbi:MAG: hypothetical protein IKH21_03385 [Clostridia bacterium]|nr:hypothetical protein [Clostridia bacterium]MBR5714650.1 hypothetical protein [Clostridia bacterium]MBR5718482.1 hypothetical protein [Clostridia bacterium]